MNKATRNWEGERNYWLGHFGQYCPGERRRSSSYSITENDYIGIPIPLNMPTPLVSPCLTWRWGLRGRGYGGVGGRYAHVVAYEQSRGCGVSSESGEQVNHLCHRPFCIQPAHLYLGDAQTNAEDRKALGAEVATYKTWVQIGDRYDKAMTEFYWKAPEIERALLGFIEPLECPHDFGTIKSAGDALVCANCGDVSRHPDEVNHRQPCWERLYGSPFSRCWCEPCCCRRCLEVMLGPAQRNFERTRDWPVYSLGGRIPDDFFDKSKPLSRKDSRVIWATLKKWGSADATARRCVPTGI